MSAMQSKLIEEFADAEYAHSYMDGYTIEIPVQASPTPVGYRRNSELRPASRPHTLRSNRAAGAVPQLSGHGRSDVLVESPSAAPKGRVKM